MTATYQAITRNIRVRIAPEYLADRSHPERSQYFWAYHVEITNMGTIEAQLTHRHWKITDAQGRVEEVRGPGVIGEQPVLSPGERFRYTSGCPLTTPSGIMVGSYRFVADTGEAFDVEIPAFSLDTPDVQRTVN